MPKSGHTRALESPSGVRAELVTLQAARERLGEGAVGGSGNSPDTMVWLVTMEGHWTITGGPPTATGAAIPTPAFHHFAIALDAKTGVVISEQATEQ